jgi:hypothetical protein
MKLIVTRKALIAAFVVALTFASSPSHDLTRTHASLTDCVLNFMNPFLAENLWE